MKNNSFSTCFGMVNDPGRKCSIALPFPPSSVLLLEKDGLLIGETRESVPPTRHISLLGKVKC